MKRTRLITLIVLVSVLLTSCSILTPAEPTPTPTPLPPAPTATETPTPEPTATSVPTATPTPLYPAEGFGPTNFPEDIDPLTGLKVEDPAILNRRPILIKVQTCREAAPAIRLSKAI